MTKELNLETLVGLTLKEVTEKIGSSYDVRVCSIGETQLMGTLDYRTDRVNLDLSSDGMVSKQASIPLSDGTVFTETYFDEKENNDFQAAIVKNAYIG